MTVAAAPRPGVVRRFLTGAGFLLTGLRGWGTAPKLLLLGVVPALIVAAVILAGLVALFFVADDFAAFLTPFAEAWMEPWRSGLRAVLGFALIAAVVLLAMFTFTTVTLAVGGPFYEKIWLATEQRLGGAPVPPERGAWAAVGRGVGDGIRTFLPTVGVAILLLPLGFVPLVGGAVVAVIGAITGGWFLTVELTAFAFDGRGHTLTGRRRVLRADRVTALGFGVATYVLFLVPFGAVIGMPAAVVGASMLSRRMLGATDSETPTEAEPTV